MPNNNANYDDIMRLASPTKTGKASLFDFHNKDQFSPGQIKFLERIFTEFSEGVITNLAPLLESRFNMSLQPITAKNYSGYINNLEETLPILIFQPEKDVLGLIDIDFSLASGIFDRLLGGKGQPFKDCERDYFTDLEKAVLQKPLKKMLEAYSQAWKSIIPQKVKIISTEYNPLAVHIASPSELMAIFTFRAEIAFEGNIRVVLPYSFLKKVVPKVSYGEYMENIRNKGVAQPASQPGLAKCLESAKVPLTLVLGRAELLFQELLSCEVGDIIRLDTQLTEPLRLKVGHRTKFLTHPGILHSKMACKVSQILDEQNEEIYD